MPQIYKADYCLKHFKLVCLRLQIPGRMKKSRRGQIENANQNENMRKDKFIFFIVETNVYTF